MDDPHWDMVGPESHRLFPEDNVALARMELEADVEYLVVEGAWQCYRMTGDDKWLASVLPALEKGIDYQTSDPMRWEPSLGLCIRPYTIDTWDYTNPDYPIRHITKIGSVVEVSAVTWPAYDSTFIDARNNEALESAKAVLERAKRLRDQSVDTDALKLAKAKYHII